MARTPSKHLSAQFLKKVMASRNTSHDARGGVKDYDKRETRALYNKKSNTLASREESKFSKIEHLIRGKRKRKARVQIYEKGSNTFFFGKTGYLSSKSNKSGRWVTIRGSRVYLVSNNASIPF